MTAEPVFTSDEGRSVYLLRVEVEIDWATQGDEFIHRLQRRLSEIVGVPSNGLEMRTVHAGGPPLYRRYSFAGPPLSTALAIIPMKDGSWRAGVEADDFEGAASEAPIWVEAINLALLDLGEVENHRWWGVILPTSAFSNVLSLGGDAQVGDVNLTDTAKPYARMQPQTPRGLRRGGSVEVGYPVVASGLAHGFHQAAAMDAANRRLLDACAALTLDTGEFWELVEKPAPHEWPVEALPSAEEPMLEDAAEENYEIRQLHPTDFASRTLARMDVDSEVHALIAGYYHAYSIEKTSPSLAAVTYVSIVESIGSKVEPLRKCECCEACEQRIGYARQFREALKLVLPKGEAKRLAVLYDKRSKTAHQGALHGEEFHALGFLNTFDRDPSRYFLYTEVWHIRAAAAALLRLFVSDELPKPNSHTAPDAG